MGGKNGVLLAAIGLSIVLGTVPAGAAVPVYMPRTITASGVYEVTNNITHTGTPIIDIVGTGTETVVVDLKGYTLTLGGGPGPVINANNVRSLTVRNGTVVDMSAPAEHGIAATMVADMNISEMTIANANKGIYLLDCEVFSITDNDIVGSADDGITVDGGTIPAMTKGTITNNKVVNAGFNGIRVMNNNTDVEVLSNRVNTVAGAGILLMMGSNCTVDENRVAGAGVDGAALDNMQSCKMTENTARNNGASGLFVFNSNDNLVEGNISLMNNGSGLAVSGNRNEIIDNHLNGNSHMGLHFEPGANLSFFQGNIARGNTGVVGPACTGPAPLCGGLVAPDYCGEGTATTSGGNNYAPGPPPC